MVARPCPSPHGQFAAGLTDPSLTTSLPSSLTTKQRCCPHKLHFHFNGFEIMSGRSERGATSSEPSSVNSEH